MAGPIHCFTSFTFAYLSRARVLAQTLKRWNPEWVLWGLVVDENPGGVELSPGRDGFDEIVAVTELGLPGLDAWLFTHDVVEACTAVKGWFACQLLDRGFERIVYLDPDIAVFDRLDDLEQRLQRADIVLTPHQLSPENSRMAIVDNEICSLRHGTYNLGFLGLRNGDDGRAFARWWRDRLRDFCFADIPAGLFTDQRWCDLVPGFFESHDIVRHPGYNVASWNLSHRRLEVAPGGELLVNGQRLQFYHFTKLGPVGETMTARYAGDGLAVHELWSWYRRMVQRCTDPAIPEGYWRYATFADGTPIPAAARRLYRKRRDLQLAFPAPFASGADSYQRWFSAHGDPATELAGETECPSST